MASDPFKSLWISAIIANRGMYISPLEYCLSIKHRSWPGVFVPGAQSTGPVHSPYSPLPLTCQWRQSGNNSVRTWRDKLTTKSKGEEAGEARYGVKWKTDPLCQERGSRATRDSILMTKCAKSEAMSTSWWSSYDYIHSQWASFLPGSLWFSCVGRQCFLPLWLGLAN